MGVGGQAGEIGGGKGRLKGSELHLKS